MTADLHRDDPKRSFIASLRSLADASGAEGMTVRDMVDRLDERATALLILALAIPCLVPGLPGAQIIAVPIFLLAAQAAIGRSEPWLPGWFLRLRAKREWIEGIAGFSEKRLGWTERIARPRATFLAAGLGERLAALIVALAAVTIMLPITNTIPSLAITVLAVGLLQRDGIFVALGALLALAWIALLSLIVVGFAFGAAFAVDFVREQAPWALQWMGAAP